MNMNVGGLFSRPPNTILEVVYSTQTAQTTWESWVHLGIPHFKKNNGALSGGSVVRVPWRVLGSLPGQGHIPELLRSTAGLLAVTSSRSCSPDYSGVLPCFSLEERVDHSANCKQQLQEKEKHAVFFLDCKESSYHVLLPWHWGTRERSIPTPE